MMDNNNTYKKPLQAFLLLILFSTAVALGRYFLWQPQADVIINFSPPLIAFLFAGLLKLSERFLGSAIFISAAFLAVFSLWGYQQYLLINQIDYILLLGFTVLLIWHSIFSKINIIVSSIALIALLVTFKFVALATNQLLIYYAVNGILSIGLGAYLYSLVSFSSQYLPPEKKLVPAQEAVPFFNDSEKEPKPEIAEPVISMLTTSEEEQSCDWGIAIQNLYSVLKFVPDVDQVFNKTLQYMQKLIDYDAAAVGMIQDKSINKIAELGSENMLHNSMLDWNTSRINALKSTSSAALEKQKYLGPENKSIELYRMDIPIRSSNNILGIMTVFRSASLFNEYETCLTSNIIFHCMMALRQSRFQEEIKRLSACGKNKTLLSREQFVEKSNLELNALSRPRSFSILIVEIDNFYKIKDQYGEETSLAAYKKIAASLISILGEKDILGRYGKEGYIVLLHETDLLDAKKTAEIIRKKIEQTKIKIPGGVSSTTVSIGLTTVSDQHENMMSIIRKADMGLFVAKESGYNTVKVSL